MTGITDWRIARSLGAPPPGTIQAVCDFHTAAVVSQPLPTLQTAAWRGLPTLPRWQPDYREVSRANILGPETQWQCGSQWKPRPDCFPIHRRIHFPFCDSFGGTLGVPSGTLATVGEFYLTGLVENGRRYQPFAIDFPSLTHS